MKPGIAIYLPCMHEGSWKGKEITAMAGMVKDASGFRRKNIVREHAIKRIAVLLEKRTEGIMDANRRNYYRE